MTSALGLRDTVKFLSVDHKRLAQRKRAGGVATMYDARTHERRPKHEAHT